MGARNRVRVGLTYRPTKARNCKRLRSPGIDSWAPKTFYKFGLRLLSLAESILWESIPGLLKSLQIPSLAVRYPIPTRFNFLDPHT